MWHRILCGIVTLLAFSAAAADMPPLYTYPSAPAGLSLQSAPVRTDMSISYQSAGSGSNLQTDGTSVQVSNLTWAEGDLLVVFATMSWGTVTASVSDSSTNTWHTTKFDGGTSWDYVISWAIVGAGKGGSSKSVTVGSGLAHDYIGAHVLCFSSSTGWPADPTDSGASTNVSGTISGTQSTLTAPGATAQNIELEVAHFGLDGTITTDPDGWQRGFLIDSNASASYYRIASTTETPSATFNFNSVTTKFRAAILWSFKPNVPATTTQQEGFRWRNDDGDETTATWAEDQDADLTALGGTQRIRMLIDGSGDPDSAQYQLEYRISGGTWIKVQ